MKRFTDRSVCKCNLFEIHLSFNTYLLYFFPQCTTPHSSGDEAQTERDNIFCTYDNDAAKNKRERERERHTYSGNEN